MATTRSEARIMSEMPPISEGKVGEADQKIMTTRTKKIKGGQESFDAWYLALSPVEGVNVVYWRTDADLTLKCTSARFYPKKKIAEDAARKYYAGENLVAVKCTITYQLPNKRKNV